MTKIDITHDVIAAAITIHRKLGPGLLESVYESCLAYELDKAGFRVERQKAFLSFTKQSSSTAASEPIQLLTENWW